MEKPKRIIVSVTNDIATDQRVLKVCGFLKKMGFEVTIVGRLRKDSLPNTNIPFKTVRFKLWFNKGALFYASYNIRLFFFLLTHRSEWLLANDLDTLPANYLAWRLNKKRKLVYDSHEFYTGSAELVHRPRVKKFWERIESFIFPKLQKIYTVNESIANLYAAKYNKKLAVVRNVPLLKERKLTKSKKELNIPGNKFLVILQGAGINVNRGAEEAIEAVSTLENTLLIIAGSGDVIQSLKQTVKREKLENKVLFFPKMPFEELMQITLLCDVGLSLDKNMSENYRYSLPNKLFDYIHVEIPVIASKLVEVEKIISNYNVGLLVDEVNAKNIASCISRLRDDKTLLEKLTKNTKKAKTELNWQIEEKVLETIYT
ncbi:MAG: glycosyltransferase [Flavobacteriales bacterium]